MPSCKSQILYVVIIHARKGVRVYSYTHNRNKHAVDINVNIRLRLSVTTHYLLLIEVYEGIVQPIPPTLACHLKLHGEVGKGA